MDSSHITLGNVNMSTVECENINGVDACSDAKSM